MKKIIIIMLIMVSLCTLISCYSDDSSEDPPFIQVARAIANAGDKIFESKTLSPKNIKKNFLKVISKLYYIVEEDFPSYKMVDNKTTDGKEIKKLQKGLSTIGVENVVGNYTVITLSINEPDFKLSGNVAAYFLFNINIANLDLVLIEGDTTISVAGNFTGVEFDGTINGQAANFSLTEAELEKYIN